jgi:hypothetical protein
MPRPAQATDILYAVSYIARGRAIDQVIALDIDVDTAGALRTTCACRGWTNPTPGIFATS